MHKILQVLQEAAAEEPVTPPPVVTLKGVGPKWKDIVIDGVKAGYVTQDWIDVATPLTGRRGARKMLLWTGEFTYDGSKISVGQTEKASALLPKIEKLIRSYTVRKNASTSDIS